MVLCENRSLLLACFLVHKDALCCAIICCFIFEGKVTKDGQYNLTILQDPENLRPRILIRSALIELDDAL